MIYLDNAATSPLLPEVISAMTEVMTTSFGNPSSIHGLGRQASKLLRDSRQTMASLLGTQADRLIFTSGGTESNNLAIKGYALANQDKGKHLISSQLEHHAVLDTLAYLAERFGFEVTLLPPSADGTITPQQLQATLREDTILVSLMWANNETGHINPIADLAQVLTDHQAVFHVDAVQAVGKLAIRPDELGIDFLSASAHKFHGPKGVGFLYAKEHHYDKLFHGGDQEGKRRASTENLTGIVGMAKALEIAENKREATWQELTKLKNQLLAGLGQDHFYCNSPDTALPQVISLGVKGQNNALLLTRLDLAGIAVSSGSACTAGNVEPSHVLTALYGADSPVIKETIRISLSSLTSSEEIDTLIHTLKQIVG